LAISRYANTEITSVDRREYSEIFKNRAKKNALIIKFEKLKELKIEDLDGILLETHIWVPSDRFFKLSSKYYGSPMYWWVIAYFNNTPLETDVKVGQKLLIPIPIENILEALGY
tara:strand:+ start:539 stop:880 length:342 start_codon:yes stop_codon:yes gene_type:complete